MGKKWNGASAYNYDIRTYQLRSVALLETIDKVCREHGIRYFVIDGTLLGAVRHKGFIPWDDDMDIAMLRQDYDLLVQHADEWLPRPFSIVSYDRSESYPKYFAKLEDTSTTVVENIHLGYAGGIYMDVFPMDDVPDCKLLRLLHFWRFNFARRILYLVYRNPYKHGHGLNSLPPLLIQKLFTARQIHDWAQRILKEYNGKGRCHYVMTHDDGRTAFRKSLFETEPAIVEFEGLKACAPADPDEILTSIYGDYMTLPPEEKRRAHFHDYCDLDKPYAGFDIDSI